MAFIFMDMNMEFQEIEYAGFRSWPSIEETVNDGVVLRYSHGYTKRANSATVTLPQKGNYAALVSRCESYFEEKGLPCIFRLPSFCNNQPLDRYLDRCDYKAIDRSLILYRSLAGASFESSNLIMKNCHEWMASYCRIRDMDINQHSAHMEILQRIKDKVVMAVLLDNNEEVACGIGVISNGYFGVFDVVSKQTARKMGHGTKLMNGMLNWAMLNGATKAYLQVVADNHAAISLYKKLGYQNCYEYWYRISNK